MYLYSKRGFDVVLASLVLVAILPLLVLIMIVLRCTGEGEIFYFQKRVGYRNSHFYIWKFATMLKNSLELGTGSITLQNDFRVTKVGRFLRKTKINELPQLFNIVKGDLSIVGPRPVLEQDWELYPDAIRNKIYDVQPGLTGIGSIVFRDEEALVSSVTGEDYHEFYERVIAPYKGELEVWYQANRSFLLDVKLIILTALVIVWPSNRLHESWLSGLPERGF